MGDRYISGDPPSKEEKIQLKLERLEHIWRMADRARDPNSNYKVKTTPTEEDYARLEQRYGLSREHVDAIQICRIPRGADTTLDDRGNEIKNTNPGYNFGQALGNASASACGGGLLFWIRNEHNERTFCIGFPDQIRPGGGKREMPPGFTGFIPLHFAHGYLERVQAGATIYVAESPQGAEALAQRGKAAIGLTCGVSSGMKPDSKKIVHRDLLRQIALWKRYGNDVVGVPDSDVRYNPDVRSSVDRLIKGLRRELKGSPNRVVHIELPDDANSPDDHLGEKVGVDDFLKRPDGVAELDALTAHALDDPSALPSILGKDYHDLAQDFLEESEQTIKFGYADSFWQWSPEHMCYQRVSDAKLGRMITSFLIKRYTDVRKSVKFEVIDILKSLEEFPDDAKPPFWIDEPPENFRDLNLVECIIAKNMVVHLPTMSTHPVGPDLFFTSSLGTHWDPDAKWEEWKECIDMWLRDNEPAKLLLQEFFGYFLTADNRFEIAALMWGKPGSGKGTVTETLTALLGGDSAVYEGDFLSLGTRFGRAPLVGKLLMTMSELDLPERADDRVKRALEVFKKIVGNGSIPVEEKGRDGYSCKVPTRFLATSNELPILPDAAGSQERRWKVLHFRYAIQNRDPNLKKTLLGLLPGILNYSIEGYQRLHGDGKFTEIPIAEGETSDLGMMTEVGSPFKRFGEECCSFGEQKRVSWKALYSIYENHWCLTNNEVAVPPDRFKVKMHAAFDIENKRMPRGSRGPGCVGLTLKPEYRFAAIVDADDDIVDDDESHEPVKSAEKPGTEGMTGTVAKYH